MDIHNMEHTSDLYPLCYFSEVVEVSQTGNKAKNATFSANFSLQFASAKLQSFFKLDKKNTRQLKNGCKFGTEFDTNAWGLTGRWD